MPAAPAETRSYHVNGPLILQATVGSALAYAVVGVAEDGADLEFVTYRRKVKTDGTGGPEGGEATYTFLNACVVLKCTLVPFAGVYVNRLRAAADAHVFGTVGTVPQSGTMYAPATFNNLVGVGFLSNDIDGGWLFPSCLVKMPGNMKASPQVSKPQFEFHAVNYLNGNTTATILNNVLYQRT